MIFEPYNNVGTAPNTVLQPYYIPQMDLAAFPEPLVEYPGPLPSVASPVLQPAFVPLDEYPRMDNDGVRRPFLSDLAPQDRNDIQEILVKTVYQTLSSHPHFGLISCTVFFFGELTDKEGKVKASLQHALVVGSLTVLTLGVQFGLVVIWLYNTWRHWSAANACVDAGKLWCETNFDVVSGRIYYAFVVLGVFFLSLTIKLMLEDYQLSKVQLKVLKESETYTTHTNADDLVDEVERKLAEGNPNFRSKGDVRQYMEENLFASSAWVGVCNAVDSFINVSLVYLVYIANFFVLYYTVDVHDMVFNAVALLFFVDIDDFVKVFLFKNYFVDEEGLFNHMFRYQWLDPERKSAKKTVKKGVVWVNRVVGCVALIAVVGLTIAGFVCKPQINIYEYSETEACPSS
jgi:hypothetical protein